MINYNFEVDEDTAIVFRIISRYLIKYFDYSIEEIILSINNVYAVQRPRFVNETERDFMDYNFHHDHPFLVACRIHFFNDVALKKDYSDVETWLRDINWFNIPDEAMIDYRIWYDIEYKG